MLRAPRATWHNVLVMTNLANTERMTFNGPEPRRPLHVGMVVETPDGDIGHLEAIEGRDYYVTHYDRALGRGPWFFTADQLLEADDFAADSYIKACDRQHYGVG